MQVQSYLMFNGRTEEAIDFYKKALGAQVEMVLRFKDAPEGQCAPGLENKIMHSSFKIGDTVMMASDGMCSGDRCPGTRSATWWRRRKPACVTRRGAWTSCITSIPNTGCNTCPWQLARFHGGPGWSQRSTSRSMSSAT